MLKTNSEGSHVVVDLDKGHRTILKGGTYQYKDRNEREKAFENLLIELHKFRDKEGVQINMPQLEEIRNIYWQAEESSNA